SDADCFVQLFKNTRAHLRLGDRRIGLLGWSGQTPVAILADRAACIVSQPGARRKLADRTEGRVWIGQAGELKIESQRVAVYFEWNSRGAQTEELAAEENSSRQGGVIQGLLTE